MKRLQIALGGCLIVVALSASALIASGGRLTVLVVAGTGIARLVSLILRRPDMVIRAALVLGVPIVIAGLLPVDVRVQRSGRIAAAIGPVVWGPVTPDTMARAPRDAVFTGRCVQPPIPTRLVVVLGTP